MSCQWGLATTDALIDKDQPFTLKLDGNSLVISGTLSDGEKPNETWKRAE